ncbi:hypothetical protein OC505_25155, partial [Pseudomonas brassicacearum]
FFVLGCVVFWGGGLFVGVFRHFFLPVGVGCVAGVVVGVGLVLGVVGGGVGVGGVVVVAGGWFYVLLGWGLCFVVLVLM